MTLVYEDDGVLRAYTKGAPEVVLARTRADSMQPVSPTATSVGGSGSASPGSRRTRPSARLFPLTMPSSGELELVGLVGLQDPLRESAADAVRSAREAGLRIQILTGDHPATAVAIARELELPGEAAAWLASRPADKLQPRDEPSGAR